MDLTKKIASFSTKQLFIIGIVIAVLIVVWMNWAAIESKLKSQ